MVLIAKHLLPFALYSRIHSEQGELSFPCFQYIVLTRQGQVRSLPQFWWLLVLYYCFSRLQALSLLIAFADCSISIVSSFELATIAFIHSHCTSSSPWLAFPHVYCYWYLSWPSGSFFSLATGSATPSSFPCFFQANHICTFPDLILSGCNYIKRIRFPLFTV